MILLQDAGNIVPGVRGDQNVRNREGNQQSQRDSRPTQHEATLAGSTFVSMKKHKGTGSTFSAVALRGLGGHDFSKRNQPRHPSDWAAQGRRCGWSLLARLRVLSGLGTIP